MEEIRDSLHSDLAIPPGAFLEEVLLDLGMTKDELARRMGRPASKLSSIFKGEKAITAETALQLERTVGVPAHIWTGLESEYRIVLEHAKRNEVLKEEIPLLKKFRYSDLVKIGEVEKKTKPLEKVHELQEFFGVVSLKSVSELNRYQVAFRRGKTLQASPEALASWLRIGERRAQHTVCSPYSKSLLQSTLIKLRSLTMKSPEEFLPETQDSLSECGVALVICPHFPGTGVHGATFWLRKDKAVVMTSILRKWADIFWFSLFHEIGHILLHGRQSVILEDDGKDDREEEADTYAADALIPPEAYKQFLQQRDVRLAKVKNYAERIGIHPGILVGRLQHDGYLKHACGNGLRTRYKWQ